MNGRAEREPVPYSGRLIRTLVRTVEKAFSDVLCVNCNRVEGDHMHDGDWCPTESGLHGTTQFSPVMADRICALCGLVQSKHLIGRFCPPSPERTGLLGEFRPRETPKICPTCLGAGQVGRPFDADTDPCGECKGRGRL